MSIAQSVLFSIVGVVILDWLFVGKVAAGFADFDYRYWPLTRARFATLVVVAVTASVSAIIFIPGAMPVWPLFVWLMVLGLWIMVAIDDVARQRSLGYRTPPRYSEPDE